MKCFADLYLVAFRVATADPRGTNARCPAMRPTLCRTSHRRRVLIVRRPSPDHVTGVVAGPRVGCLPRGVDRHPLHLRGCANVASPRELQRSLFVVNRAAYLLEPSRNGCPRAARESIDLG